MANAKKSDWNTQPMPAKRAVLQLDETFTKAEMTRIRRGLVPREMEEKWFIYFEKDTLFLHRSWTGACLYTVRFEPRPDGGAHMMEALVNRDPEQYTETADAKTVLRLVRTLLLHEPFEFPSDGDATTTTDHAPGKRGLPGASSASRRAWEEDPDGRPRTDTSSGQPLSADGAAIAPKSAPNTRDYFAELYVAALFGDAGWSVYFPKRDVGFDFMATKPVRGEMLIRPVQVKGLYPTAIKTDKVTYGFRGELTAVHQSMVLAMPFFHKENPLSPELCAFIPLDQCKSPSSGGIRAEPAKFVSGHALPRRDFVKYFDRPGLARVEDARWGHGA